MSRKEYSHTLNGTPPGQSVTTIHVRVAVMNIEYIILFIIIINKYINADELQIGDESTDDWNHNVWKRYDVKIMRLFYVTKPDGSGPEPPPTVSCRLFTPAKCGANNFETMTQLMFRIDCWLRATGTSTF